MDLHQIIEQLAADLHNAQNDDVAYGRRLPAECNITSTPADLNRFSAASLDNLIDRFSNRKRKQPETTTDRNRTGRRRLSTDEILKLAGARIIQSSTWTAEDDGAVNVPLPDTVDDHRDGIITPEESKNVELVEYLLRSAEKFGKGEFGQASGLLDFCETLGPRDLQTGDPIQRAAYYFCNALREKMTAEENNRNSNTTVSASVEARKVVVLPAGRVPFFMASQMAGVQAVLESVWAEKRVHVVDLRIRSGLAMIALIQALSGRGNEAPQLELLKVTAVADDESEVEVWRETGVRLASFASEMNVPFAFKIAKQAQVLGLRKTQLQINSKEATVVYSEYALSPLISTPSRLHALMRLVKSIRPRLMVVVETEANHNSPDFGHRFVESLFTAAACFDCLAECCAPAAADAKDDDPAGMREAVGARFLGERIRNVVAAEGAERVVRDVRIGVWRKYFARCGMLEIELSELAVRHARLVVNRFPCGAACVVGAEGKSVVMGWKDTPLLCVSTWKFVGPKKARAAVEKKQRRRSGKRNG
ncbi:unnamed protein product [Linum tenue]|uniref:DELLA protein n=2 Tax=Linum tenue TaxID=586396 RepID=A0AAV0P7V5_9ROSI|nr:unnamed protein product [Linum tenue]